MNDRPADINVPPGVDPVTAFAAGAVYGAAVHKYRAGGDRQACAALADTMRAVVTGDTLEAIALTAYNSWRDEFTKESKTNGA